MGLPLLLPLLLLLLLLLPPASLQGDHWAQLKARFDYGMNQPTQLSAPEGGSIRIPFFFYYSQDSGSVSNVIISWRWKHFHGDFIYKTTPRLIHNNFKNRLLLNWEEGMKNGSLQISNLRREDEGLYFCQVEMITEKYGEQEWQSIQGTELTITHNQTTILGSTTTAAATAGLGTSEDQRHSPSTEAAVGIAANELIIAIAGLILCL